MKKWGIALFLLALLVSVDAFSNSFDQFVYQVWRQNPDIQIQRHVLESARYSLRVQKGGYDPVLSASILSNPNPVIANSNSLSLSQQLPFGTTLQLGFNSSKSMLNQLYNSSLSLDFTVPLFRHISATDFAIEAARLDVERATWEVRTQSNTLLLSAVSDYFTYIIQLQNQAAQHINVESATFLFKETQKRVALGTASELDSLEAQAALETAKDALLLAQLDCIKSQQTLWSSLGEFGQTKPQFALPSPNALVSRFASLGSLGRRYADANPALQAARLDNLKAHYQLVYAKQQVWPELDLQTNLLYRQFNTTQMANPLSDSPSTMLGVSMRFPILNRSATSRVHLQELALNQAQLEIAKLSQALDNQFLELNLELPIKQELVLHAVTVSQLAERRLELAKKRYQLGLNVVKDITDAQKAYVDAQVRLSQTLSDYVQARLALENLGGNLESFLGLEAM